MQFMVTKKATALLFLRRCTAYALDCLLLFFVTIVLFQGLIWLLTQGAWWNNLRTWITVQGWIAFSVVLPTWLYFSLFEASPWQATFGKRLLGLHVTDMSGKRPGSAAYSPPQFSQAHSLVLHSHRNPCPIFYRFDLIRTVAAFDELVVELPDDR